MILINVKDESWILKWILFFQLDISKFEMINYHVSLIMNDLRYVKQSNLLWLLLVLTIYMASNVSCGCYSSQLFILIEVLEVQNSS